jgi:trehalose 6-phosphate synthase/phosphatase
MDEDGRKLIIASNRLPFIIERDGGSWRLLPGSGGLVTALAPVLRDRGGIWIGWPGLAGAVDISEQIERASADAGFDMKPVHLDDEDVQRYYKGLSNEVLWPLFHDLQSYCNFDPSYWQSYLDINARFARVIGEHALAGDFIWIHDYHLLATASEIRKAGALTNMGFFLHIPFPPLDIFAKLPWRKEILRSMLDYDLIGLQTPRDRRNLVQCLRTFIDDITIEGKGQVIEARARERTIRIGYFPISIDYEEFSQLAGSREVADAAWFIHEDIPKGKIVLGVDRLDYTKGIPYRLRAFENFLEKHPELHRKITLVQVVVPSRRDIPVYEDLKTEIERMVGEINGRFTRSGWVPIHYIFRSLSRPELLGYYRTAEIALITPIKDGMNLVAKEYCASNIEKSGVLILSEFAGASPQMKKGAILVNPYNIEQVSDAIYRAWTMDLHERRARMEKLQSSVARNDIYWWVNSYLKASLAGQLDDFPTVSLINPR